MVLVVAALCVGAAACGGGSEPTQPLQDPSATPAAGGASPAAAEATSAPPGAARFSNAVPSVEELLEIGLSRDEAECFIARLDPEGTGTLTDADRFTLAMSECLGG